MAAVALSSYFFFFNDTATTEIYTLSLHDALPIYAPVTRHVERFHRQARQAAVFGIGGCRVLCRCRLLWRCGRSEEHTSELQSRPHLVCRLLLVKKKKTYEHVTAQSTTSSMYTDVR